jgi:hypothetical protein
MSEDSPSLKAFILGDPPNAALSQCVASVTAALGTSLFDVRHFDWSSLAGDILEKLEQMFDIRVTDILAAAWKDYQALIDCADPAKHSADETISLPMADHHVETSLQPCLEIVVGERPPVRITFEITCDLELKGLVVKVQDASIRALRIGACRAKGSVKCEGMLLIRRETKDLDLPGRITLSPGIPIKRPSTAAVGKNADRWHPGDPHDDRELMSAMPI